MTARERFYISTPIYYVNDKPHLGHAYTTIAADVLARFHRLDGREVLFLTGTDEHGQKVEKSAKAAGETPQAFCDRVSQTFRDLTRTLDCSNDDFIRTTEPRHVAGAQALWRALEKNGQLYLGKYAGWYAVRDEAYYGEEETQVGEDGKRRAIGSGAEVEWVEEESWFFKLSAWQQPLLDWYAGDPDRVLPETRRNEVLSFVRGGLRDLSVSRTTFTWGIPVPGHPRHIFYVWLDALSNYVTALGYPDVQSERFVKFWPAAVHLMGKDILRFHAVYWPAFLMAAGVDPPRQVFAHGWWTREGQKMSKTVGNVIDPNELVAQYGADALRFFVLREVSFGQDGDFAQAAFVRRLNGDLANGLGNLAQRALSMIQKSCDAKVPQPQPFTPDDEALLAAARDLLPLMRTALTAIAPHEALKHFFDVVDAANRYVDVQAPWALKKTDPPRMATVLYVVAETVRHLAILIQPFMPSSAAKLLDQLGLGSGERGFDRVGAQSALKPGTPLPAPTGVFPRVT